MGDTGIDYVTKTWSPVVGCTKVSPGCDNCWALRGTWRMAHNPNPKMQATYGGLVESFWRPGEQHRSHSIDWSGVVRCLPERLDEPLHWRKRQRVFVVSMGDLFHEDVPWVFLDKVWGAMWGAHQHQFLVLTKRPDRMRHYIVNRRFSDTNLVALRNVWLGVTAEDQQRADERIPILLATPAARRWISVEPMLGPVDLFPWLTHLSCSHGNLAPESDSRCQPCGCWPDRAPISWVVAGCESGPERRPANPDWFRSLREQCRSAAVPYFLKQMEVPDDLTGRFRLEHQPWLDGRQWLEVPDAHR